VVDNARRLISTTIDVVVTSVLQTTAGKMIFGRHIEPAPPAAAQPASLTAAGAASPEREENSRRSRPVSQP
jgi:hypothetical protein